MGLTPGTKMTDIELDVVWIGSCTNGRIEDLPRVAKVVEGKSISSRLEYAMIVPGSGLVKEQAEAEGLDKIFTAAGFQWREPGCSMCLGMNPDQLKRGPALRFHLEPQFRGPAGLQGPHASRLAGHGRRRGDCGSIRRYPEHAVSSDPRPPKMEQGEGFFSSSLARAGTLRRAGCAQAECRAGGTRSRSGPRGSVGVSP